MIGTSGDSVGRWRWPNRADVLWMAGVAVIFLAAAAILSRWGSFDIDRAMRLAIGLTQGRLDLDPDSRNNDIVTIDGRLYQALSPLPIFAYLPFVPFPDLWGAARSILPAAWGVATAWLALPLARRYGVTDGASYWLATSFALGTVLFTLAIQSNYYYLAQVQATFFTFVALLELSGRRRPWLIALAFGVAGLARPTVLLALAPIGLLLLVDSRRRLRDIAELVVPVAFTLAIAAWYNVARFGSPLETGYGISHLNGVLAERRAIGLFSIRHLPDNLARLLGQGFEVRDAVPYLVPDRGGHSILLTSPWVIAAVGAGFRHRVPIALWAATAIVAIPVLLYYGGGGPVTYGYRYALDVLPFVYALACIAAVGRFGPVERVLVALSVAFSTYGFVWFLSA